MSSVGELFSLTSSAAGAMKTRLETSSAEQPPHPVPNRAVAMSREQNIEASVHNVHIRYANAIITSPCRQMPQSACQQSTCSISSARPADAAAKNACTSTRTRIHLT